MPVVIPVRQTEKEIVFKINSICVSHFKKKIVQQKHIGNLLIDGTIRYGRSDHIHFEKN